jgi:lipopolysaccharide export system permease protein
MSLFARYIFRQALAAMLLILLSLTGVVWVAVALRELNLITGQGQNALTFLKMTSLALPNLMALIAPIALLIASIHALNRLNGDSELIVLTAAGAGPLAAARPLLVLGLITAAGVAFVNHVGQPWSLRTLREAVIQVRTDLLAQVVKPGRFSTPERGLTFHIRDRNLNGDLLGLLLHDSRNEKQVMSYLAERGVVVKQGEDSHLLMERGHIVQRTSRDEPAEIVRFATYAVDLDRFERKTDRVELKPRERYFGELASPDPEDPDFKRQPGHFRAELHERFASPLYPLAFVMIAVAFVGQARSTRQNRIEAIVVAFLAAAALRLGGLAVNNLVVINAKAVPLLYGLPAMAIVIALLAVRRNARPRPGPGLYDRISMGLEDLFAPLHARLARVEARRPTDRRRR